MKNIYFLAFLIVLIGCQKANNKTDLTSKDSISINHSDTIYVDKSDCIVPDWIYLDMDSITNGSPFDDKDGNYGFYRLIFTMSEETKNLFAEKLTIIGDGKVKIDKRLAIPKDILELKGYSYGEFLGWQSPEIIELKVYGEDAEEIVYVNLSSQKKIFKK